MNEPFIAVVGQKKRTWGEDEVRLFTFPSWDGANACVDTLARLGYRVRYKAVFDTGASVDCALGDELSSSTVSI